ncbi:MAG: energy transducer TonB [Candidatus Latescibacterota bacterium]|nr:MAG: energy transducer TonB [Candidatus Latescibacterota bacterium]
MPRSYHDRESEYRRRFYAIVPVSAILVLLLFVFSDVVPYRQIEKRFGWEGATHLLPEITIIPDTDPFEDVLERSRRRALAALEIEEWEETGPAEGAKREQVPENEPEEIITPELDEEIVRHYPAHTEVPYSEDYVILHMIKPEYPPYELSVGIEADVTVEILVNEDGWVEDAWVLVARGPKSFERASLAAVRQFRFKPPVVYGEPMPMWIRFQIRFRIMS